MRRVWKNKRELVNAAPRLILAWLVLAMLLVAPAPASGAELLKTRQPGQPAAITPQPVIQAMVNAVNTTTLTSIVGDLSGQNSPLIDGEPYQFQTRYTKAAVPIAKATQYVYAYLAALGLPVEFQGWDYPAEGVSGRNVVATQAGQNTTDPCIYIVTGHVDSIVFASDPMTVAPGADDDASGTAGVLMLAAVLKNYHFSCTIRYVITTGEEQGLLGSAAYANAAKTAGDPIQGVFALDMLAYKTNTDYKFELISRKTAPIGDPDLLLTNMVKDVVAGYGINLVPVGDTSDTEDADHASFWAAGFPAILVIQDSTNYNPNYHKAADTIDKLNPGYFTNMVKAVAGALAHLAVPVDPPAPSHSFFLPLTVKMGVTGVLRSAELDRSERQPVNVLLISPFQPGPRLLQVIEARKVSLQ